MPFHHCVLATPMLVVLASPALAADLSLYERGLDLCRSGRYEESRRLLKAFLAASPPADIADNALYWLGESFYAEGRYREAAEQFLEVCTRYGEENKAADSWLKLGYCRQKMGDIGQAIEALEQAMRKGAGAAVATLARSRLDELRALAGATSAPPEASASVIGGGQAPALPPPPEPAPEPAVASVAVPDDIVRPQAPAFYPSEAPKPDRLFVAHARPVFKDDVWGFAVSPESTEVFIYRKAKLNIDTKERRVKEGILIPIEGGAPRAAAPPAWFASAVKQDVLEGPKKPTPRSYAPDGVTYAYSKYYSRIRNVVVGRQGMGEHVIGTGNLPFWLPDGRLLVVGYGKDGNDSLTEGLTLLELGVR